MLTWLFWCKFTAYFRNTFSLTYLWRLLLHGANQKPNNFRSLFIVEYRKGITKPCTHFHPLAPTSALLHPPSTNSSQPPPSSLTLLEPNIARNWANSLNLGRKNKSCPSWLKIGSYGILEMLIPNLDLDFWNSDPFLDKFRFKKSKLSVLPENLHTVYLDNYDSYSDITFLSYQP